MGLTWSQVRHGAKVTEERKEKGEYFDCPGCEKPQQDSFFDTLGIEHCSACYYPISISMRIPWEDDDGETD
jgi:hypothetical protein